MLSRVENHSVNQEGDYHNRIRVSGVRWQDRSRRARETCFGIIFKEKSRSNDIDYYYYYYHYSPVILLLGTF